MTKKASLFFLLCMTFSCLAIGQVKKSSIAIGVQAGYHNSWPSFGSLDVSVARGYLPGIHAGLQLQLMSSTMLGFETNVLYTNVGWREPTEFGIYRREIKAIEWQVNTHLALGKGWLRLLADAGPYMRFYISDQSTGPSDLYHYREAFDNNFQFGIFAGGGLGLRFKHFIVQARGHFNLGLTNYFDFDLNNFSSSTDRAAGGSLSILYPLSKSQNTE